MRYLWLAAAFVVTLLVGLLAGIALGGGSEQQGSGGSSPRTVTVEKTVPARATPNPKTATTSEVHNLDEARAAFERAVESFGNPNLEVGEVTLT